MISTCEIHNFRCFKQMTIKGLRKFTFIVGASGTGKTALLEALFMTGGSSAELLFRIRRWRGLGESPMEFSGTRDSFESIFRDMFHNFDQDSGLSIRFTDTERGWRSVQVDFERKGTYEFPVKETSAENAFLAAPINFKWETPQKVINSKIEIKNGEIRVEGTPDVFPIMFVSPRTTSAKHDAKQFSELSRQNRSKPAVDAVKRVFPEVESITLENLAGEPVLHAEIQGIREKIPLVDLSAGLNKYLSLILAILINKHGSVLVDEIENGFYYANLPVILDGIFDLCDKQEVQLIASTHSYEFLEALVKAMELRGTEGKGFSCIRFERSGESGLTIAHQPLWTIIEGDRMKSAIENNFEIR